MNNNLQQLLSEGFHFKKRFGQNFIFDTNLLGAICEDAGIMANDRIVEVGAGAGTLTAELAKRAKRVISFEIDITLKQHLDKLAVEHSNIDFVYCDVLKINLGDYLVAADALGRHPFKVVANLPYYITTPVMFHFLAHPNLTSITVMVQKEVAERFIAKPNTPEYGAVTAQLRVYGTPKITRIVGRKNFNPPPNVDSAIVRLDINKIDGVKDYQHLQKLIAASFNMRRKTLVNNLMQGFNLPRQNVEKILTSLGYDLSIRGETLSIDDFVKLSNALFTF